MYEMYACFQDEVILKRGTLDVEVIAVELFGSAGRCDWLQAVLFVEHEFDSY